MLTILPVLLTVASVASPTCAVGTWVTKAGDRAIFQLTINNTPTGVAATWSRPKNFSFDGDSFSAVRGPVVNRKSQSSRLVNGDLELSFDDPRPNAAPDVFRLQCAKAGHLDVVLEATGLEPFEFVRVQAHQPPLGPWSVERTYVRMVDRSTSAEMTQIFDADQSDRAVKNIDWSVVGPADEKRRRRTQELIDSGNLHSGDDFYHAAFVFQHGGAASDFLKAHLLAIISIARGKPAAVWIASATLDRYLMNTGKPQVLGTQYLVPKNGPATQEPYDRNLVSDTLRQALNVPSSAEQERQRQHYTAPALESGKP